MLPWPAICCEVSYRPSSHVLKRWCIGAPLLLCARQSPRVARPPWEGAPSTKAAELVRTLTLHPSVAHSHAAEAKLHLSKEPQKKPSRFRVMYTFLLLCSTTVLQTQTE